MTWCRRLNWIYSKSPYKDWKTSNWRDHKKYRDGLRAAFREIANSPMLVKPSTTSANCIGTVSKDCIPVVSALANRYAKIVTLLCVPMFFRCLEGARRGR